MAKVSLKVFQFRLKSSGHTVPSFVGLKSYFNSSFTGSAICFHPLN